MRKIFLNTLIVSVSLSAVIGILVILIGNFGEFEARVLLTTFTVACASILGLACGAAYEAGRSRNLPIAGILFAVISGLSWFLIIWNSENVNEYVVKAIMSSTLIAAALAHLSLVSLARLEARFRWAVYSIFFSIAALSGLLLSFIWFTEALESDITFRVLGVLSIIAAALTILIPVLHKLSVTGSEEAAIDEEIKRLKERIAELEARKGEMSAEGRGMSNE